MITVTKDSGEKWVKNSFRAYLQGEKDLTWIAGILQGMSKEEIRILLHTQLYGLEERRNALEALLG